jgi:hypothetical protein
MQDFGIPLEWDQSPRDEDKMSIEELITEGIRVINRIVEMPEQNTAEIIT